jgi:hypothetical protein
LRRWLCADCGRTETGIEWPENCRSTPELNELHASALLTYRVAAGVLAHLLPVQTSTSPETLRGHTIKVADQLPDAANGRCAAATPAIDISLDATFVRSRHKGERHMEVRVGNVEAPGGGRQIFGAVAKGGTSILALIGRNLEIMGRNGDTKLTAFTDGCSGLRSILTDAGVTDPPILDWHHIAMRLQHAKLSAGSLADDTPGRAAAKEFIVAQVDRLHWRIWNGKARNAHVTIDRIRAVMHVFQNETRRRGTGTSSGKLWHALHEIDEYLTGQGAWLVNYAKRYRAGLRVGTSITEGTANFLVNRRMNKRQQMRWSRHGADAVIQIRCAIYNGTLGTGFGHLFNPGNEPIQQLAMAAWGLPQDWGCAVTPTHEQRKNPRNSAISWLNPTEKQAGTPNLAAVPTGAVQAAGKPPFCGMAKTHSFAVTGPLSDARRYSMVECAHQIAMIPVVSTKSS